MQTELVRAPIATEDQLWLRAAYRECILYGEHGIITEEDEQGREVCFNCGGTIHG